MTLYLHPLSPNSPGIGLDSAAVQIGRALDNQLVVVDPQVSRHHALIQWQGEHLVITDLKSTGGTFVGDRRVTQPCVIEVGDLIKIGNCLWQVIEAGDDIASPASPAMSTHYSGASDVTVAQPDNPFVQRRSRAAGCAGRGIAVVFLISVAVVAALCMITSLMAESARTNVVNANATLAALTQTPGNFKPATQSIAFVSANNSRFDLNLLDTEHGTHSRLIGNVSTSRPYAVVSPNGTRIAFTATKEGNSDLYVIDIDSLEVTQLTRSPANEDIVSWSPDGRQLVFNAFQNNDSEIYVIELDDLTLTQLTATRNANAPAWSPDGQTIAYLCGPALCQMPIDGLGRVEIASRVNELAVPVWSPDGQSLLYQCKDDLCRVGLDGSRQTLKTNQRDNVLFPIWLADGRIAFYASDIGILQLMVMNEDGSNMKQLTNLRP